MTEVGQRGLARWAAWSTASAILLAALGLSLASVRNDSITSDEPAHLSGGLVKLLDGRLDYFRTNPPLWNVITVLPLVADGVRVPQIYRPDSDIWLIGRIILFRTGIDSRRAIFLARLPTIGALLALVLAVYWFVARETGSRGWGLFAMALTAFCPLLMAHGRLATVDVPVTLFLFLAVAALLRLIESPSIPTALVVGASSAAAVLSKASGGIIGPFLLVMVAMAFALKRIRDPRRFLLHFAVAAAAGLAVAELVILGLASDAYIADNFPRLQTPLARLALPIAEGLANVRAINAWFATGHVLPQYLLGEVRSGGFRHYYAVAILLKTTIPALLVGLAGMVALVRRLPKRGVEEAAPRFASLICFLFAIVFFAIASAGELAVGVRYVIPVYPFVYAGAVIAIAEAVGGIQPRARRGAVAALAALLVWHVFENVRAYPGYIGYFNQFIGRHENADRFLIDSNLDWGQDLIRLRQWAEENGVNELGVHYFGGDNVPTVLTGIRTDIRRAPGPQPLRYEWFAVSTHFYRLSLDSDLWPVDYDSFLAANRAEYVTTVGDSIRVYRVRRP